MPVDKHFLATFSEPHLHRHNNNAKPPDIAEEASLKLFSFLTGQLFFGPPAIFAGNLIILGATSNPQYFVARAFLMCSIYAMNVLEISLGRSPLRSDPRFNHNHRI